MDIVAEHLRRWAATDFAWGKTDCSLVLADYVRDVTDLDGAAHLRGRYSDRASCVAAAGLSDGLAIVVGRCAALAGLQSTNTPLRGDIGVLRLHSLEVAGLCLGERWAVKSPEGVLFLGRPRVIAAWAVRRR